MGRALMAWFLVVGAVAGPAESPREVVQAAVGRIVTAIQRAEATPADPSPTRPLVVEQRQLELRRLVGELFDFEELSRRALSRHWAARSPEERAEFVRLVTGLLERVYVGRIEAYAGERIVYVGETIDGPYATVRSRVVGRRPSDTPLDYRLHLREGRWRAYDLLVDHVSFVATYRGEFNRILQREPYTALVERLRRQSDSAAALLRMP